MAQMNPVTEGTFDAPRFTPNQLQIIAIRDKVLGTAAEVAGRSVIKLEASTGYQATLTVNKSVPFDLAIAKINNKICELGFEKADSDLLYNLLCRTLDDPLPTNVPARSINFVFNNLHKTTKLKVDYERHRLYWGAAFDKEVEATKEARKTEDGQDENSTLLIRGSAHPLALQQTRLFGGVSYRFTEKNVLKILQKCAGRSKSIGKDDFCKAVEICVQKIVCIEDKINSPILSPIIFRRPLFPKGDIRELKL